MEVWDLKRCKSLPSENHARNRVLAKGPFGAMPKMLGDFFHFSSLTQVSSIPRSSKVFVVQAI